MTNELKSCIHAELCVDGCDLDEITECEYYRAERTCHDVLADDEQFFRCSQCGCEVMLHEEVHTRTWNALWAGELNYCPNCGAKVVE